jgi:hypothetical protein
LRQERRGRCCDGYGPRERDDLHLFKGAAPREADPIDELSRLLGVGRAIASTDMTGPAKARAPIGSGRIASAVSNTISRLLQAGKISDKHARDAEAIYGSALTDEETMFLTSDAAEAYAAHKTSQILAADALARRRDLARRVNATAQAMAELAELAAQGRKPH